LANYERKSLMKVEDLPRRERSFSPSAKIKNRGIIFFVGQTKGILGGLLFLL